MTRALGPAIRVAVVVIATGVVGYYVARNGWGVVREVFRDFVSG